MRIKTSIIISVAILLTTLISIATISSSKVQGSLDLEENEIPIEIKPLVPDRINVECDKAFVSKPDTLNTFYCNIISKTDLAIKAIGVNYSLVADVHGIEQKSRALRVAEAFIHPDIAKERLLPGKKINFSPTSPMSISNGVVKKLEIEIIYIEFSDGTSFGESSKTVERISNIREGASSYKAWIKNEYLRNGKSEENLIPLLDKNFKLESIGNNKLGNKIGIKYYRKFLRERYDKSGYGSIKEILDQ